MERTFIKRNETTQYLQQLLQRVADITGTTTNEIIERNREIDLVDIRGVFCYAARMAGIPSQKVGESIKRTHAAVLHASRRTEDLIRVKDRRIMGILDTLYKQN